MGSSQKLHPHPSHAEPSVIIQNIYAQLYSPVQI